MSQYNNVCLAGLPRSGTTLTCALLNKVPGVIAMHEPMNAKRLSKYQAREQAFDAISEFFEQTRLSIAQDGVFVAKKQALHREGIREYKVPKTLPIDFTLCIKQPAAFSALLGGLKERFACFAIIRNPLAILASWNRVDMPVRDGHSPAAEKLDRALARTLRRVENALERQLILLNWYFEQFEAHLSKSHILSYEQIIATQGSCLKVIHPQAGRLRDILAKRNAPLENKNVNPSYDKNLMKTLARTLLDSEGIYWRFYTRESVASLIE